MFGKKLIKFGDFIFSISVNQEAKELENSSPPRELAIACKKPGISAATRQQRVVVRAQAGSSSEAHAGRRRRTGDRRKAYRTAGHTQIPLVSSCVRWLFWCVEEEVILGAEVILLGFFFFFIITEFSFKIISLLCFSFYKVS